MHCQWGKKTPKMPLPRWDFVTQPEEDPATAIDNIHKNLAKIARVVREICWRTDRQTHTHRRAHHNTSPPLPRTKWWRCRNSRDDGGLFSGMIARYYMRCGVTWRSVSVYNSARRCAYRLILGALYSYTVTAGYFIWRELHFDALAIRQCRQCHYIFSSSSAALSEQILLPRYLTNCLSNLDETCRECSQATADDLARF